MKINEVAKLTGITVRTLHYYDEIDLLKPSTVTDTGYRLYGDKELEILQQILFFRELDFSLKDIKDIMENPNYDKTEALEKHKELLIEKKDRLEGLINLIDKVVKGENTMSFKEFDDSKIEENKEKYAKEVKERWENTDAYTESIQKTKKYDKNKWNEINNEGNKIMKEFFDNIDLSPTDDKVQALVSKWQNYITSSYYNCTNEILAGLGQMYIMDERFKNNIDKNGIGTAKLMSDAIKIYCSK